VVTTGYGDVREYDIRGQRRPLINASLEKGSGRQLLGKIVRSIQNEQRVYLVNQEGHIYICDRRKNYQVVKKLMGNRGSVRAMACFT
jgi:hypothetical protein